MPFKEKIVIAQLKEAIKNLNEENKQLKSENKKIKDTLSDYKEMRQKLVDEVNRFMNP